LTDVPAARAQTDPRRGGFRQRRKSLGAQLPPPLQRGNALSVRLVRPSLE
jgi:hypothetical protein